MKKLKIGVLSKLRGNFQLQAKYIGTENIKDETPAEVRHHQEALREAGYEVALIEWGPEFMKRLSEAKVDLIFNVSSLVEAAVLEEVELPYVGSNSFTIAAAADKSIAKKIWQHAGLPTSPFCVASTEEDCLPFKDNPPFPAPWFIKPIAGRGSAGVDADSVVSCYDELVEGVMKRARKIGQPVLIERFLQGREITLGIIGNGGMARVLPPLEITYKIGDVTLSFEKKKLEDDADLFTCPANLTGQELTSLRKLALDAYYHLQFRDFGRIDTIVTKNGAFLLEGNTFAGLRCTPPERPRSFIGFMARAEEMSGAQLLDEIITSAAKRYNLI
ncbi:hypothetical protein SY88_19225 [Clostridiales bacterium PH28_bin88]|nr:hypothetical protein SY88_19225 [Clostridiales bacterium PH28_bin88]